jgi:hypothetical protein
MTDVSKSGLSPSQSYFTLQSMYSEHRSDVLGSTMASSPLVLESPGLKVGVGLMAAAIASGESRNSVRKTFRASVSASKSTVSNVKRSKSLHSASNVHSGTSMAARVTTGGVEGDPSPSSQDVNERIIQEVREYDFLYSFISHAT